MINIAVMGYGTSWFRCREVIDTNGERIAQRIGDALNVKICVGHQRFSRRPDTEKVIHDFETIISDDEIQIVVEVMGGIRASVYLCEKKSSCRKCVVTSNKALGQSTVQNCFHCKRKEHKFSV